MSPEKGENHERWFIKIGDVKLGKKELIILAIGFVILALLIVAYVKFPNFGKLDRRRISAKNTPIPEEALQVPETVAPDAILPGTEGPEANIMGQTKIVLTEETFQAQYEMTFTSVPESTVLLGVAGSILVSCIIAFVVVCVRYKNKAKKTDIKIILGGIIFIAFFVVLISFFSLADGYKKENQEVTFHVYPIEVVGRDHHSRRNYKRTDHYYFIYYMDGEREVELQVEQYMYKNYHEPGLYYLISAEHDDKRKYFQLYPGSSYVLSEDVAPKS